MVYLLHLSSCMRREGIPPPRDALTGLIQTAYWIQPSERVRKVQNTLSNYEVCINRKNQIYYLDTVKTISYKKVTDGQILTIIQILQKDFHP